MYKRVTIKLSGAKLAYDEKTASCLNSNPKRKPVFHRDYIEEFAKEVKNLLEQKIQVCIVVGGGNFWRGRESDDRTNRVNSDNIGMMAIAMNSIYVSDVFDSMEVKNQLFSPVPVANIFTLFSRKGAIKSMAEGNAIIVSCGTGHPYFSTDTATAIYGSEIDSDVLLFQKSGTNGVYTKNPSEPDAQFIEKITYREILANPHIEVIDKAAAATLIETNIPSVIFGYGGGYIEKAVSGGKIGTYVCN